MKKTKTQTIRMMEVVYLGERVFDNGKIKQCFRDTKDNTYNYSRVKNLFFGSSYSIEKKSKSIKLNPEERPNQKVFVTKAETLRYAAHVEMAKHQRAKRKKALELKKPHKDIVEAIRLLRPFTHHLGWLEFDRFNNYLKNKLSTKANK